MSPTSQNYIVGNLRKFTKYEFFVAPFYRSVEGQPSNSKIVQTFEDGKWKCDEKNPSYQSPINIYKILIMRILHFVNKHT